jgi:hypothetical protein
MMNGSKGCGMTYINGIQGGLVANVVMYESPQFTTTDELLKIVTSKDIRAGEELLVDYGSEFVLRDSVGALIIAAAQVDAAGDDAAKATVDSAAGTSVVEGSADVPAPPGAAEGTSGDGPSAQDPAAAGHGSTDTSGDGASAHGSVSTGHDHDAGASQTQVSAEGTTHCSVTSTGFLTLTRFLKGLKYGKWAGRCPFPVYRISPIRSGICEATILQQRYGSCGYKVTEISG